MTKWISIFYLGNHWSFETVIKLITLFKSSLRLYCQQGMVGRVQLNPFQPQIEGHFYFNNLGTSFYAKPNISFMWPICAICLSVVRDQMLGPISEILVLPQRLHISHFTQKSKKSILMHTSYEAAVKLVCLSCLLKLFSQNFSVSAGP